MPKIMNRRLQIKTLRGMLRNANPDLDKYFETANWLPDPNNKGKYSNWTTCLKKVSLPENTRILEDRFKVKLRLPKERKRRKGPRRALLMYKSSDGTGLIADTIVVVRSHPTSDKKARVVKAFGKPFEYGYGRIQITVPKELIGIKANVHIKFPNVPPLAMETALARVSRGDKTKRPWRRPRKQLDYVQTEGGSFSKKEPKNNTQP